MTKAKLDLTSNQRRAIVYLIQEDTITDAAEATGVTRQTLHTWLQRPEFQSALRAARREVFGHAITKLQNLATKAVDTLEELLDGDPETVPPGVKLGAARAVLDVAAGASMDDLAAEVEELRNALSRSARLGN